MKPTKQNTMEAIYLQSMTEEWKDILGYEDFYQVSNLGRIMSKDRKVVLKSGLIRMTKSKILSNRNGRYLTIGLNKDRKQNQFLVHRLVAQHFVANPENKPQVNHLDGDKNNNNSSNLEWCTSGENQKHAFDNSLKSPTWLGKKISSETRAKMSKAKSGVVPWNKGIKQKDYTKKDIQQLNK